MCLTPEPSSSRLAEPDAPPLRQAAPNMALAYHVKVFDQWREGLLTSILANNVSFQSLLFNSIHSSTYASGIICGNK
jgi:hypothetical protein